MAGGNDTASDPAPAESSPRVATFGLGLFHRLWRWKWFILVGTVLPTLIAGKLFFAELRTQSVTYSFSVQQDQQDYRVLKERFFSQENIRRLAGAFEAEGLDDLAATLTTGGRRRLEFLVRFQAFPMFFEKEFVPAPGRLDDIDNLRDLRSALLEVRVTAFPTEPLVQIGAIVKENFSNAVPLMALKRDVSEKIASLAGDLADSEERRFVLSLTLQRAEAVAAGLQEMTPMADDLRDSSVVIEFSPDPVVETFLPLGVQRQAAAIQVLHLEEDLREIEARDAHAERLLVLYRQMHEELTESSDQPGYTLQDFSEVLSAMMATEQDEAVRNHIAAFVMRLEGSALRMSPLVDQPAIQRKRRHPVRQIAVVFVVAFCLSTLLADRLSRRQRSGSEA
ncbi:MAG: hypothetical protein ACYTFO_01485 [Planctomycetota bacterium]|jgi:hypothetical protein